VSQKIVCQPLTLWVHLLLKERTPGTALMNALRSTRELALTFAHDCVFPSVSINDLRVLSGTARAHFSTS
jgi:hypothetical protein